MSEPRKLSLTDELAIDRTLLANERTLLAYLRSSLALIIGGFSFLHLSDDNMLLVLGLVCIPLGVIFGLVGAWRWRRMNAAINASRHGHRDGA